MVDPGLAGAAMSSNNRAIVLSMQGSGMSKRSRRQGFTTIELLVAVVILGILVSIALPSFLNSIRKGRRAEAFTALSAIQQAQERWRANNATYTTTLANVLPYSTTPTGYYTITVGNATTAPLSSGYSATARAVSGTTQAGDSQCATLGVQMEGGTVTYAGCGPGCSPTFAPTNACWNQ